MVPYTHYEYALPGIARLVGMFQNIEDVTVLDVKDDLLEGS